MSIRRRLVKAFKELKGIFPLEPICDPDADITVARGFVVSRKSLKHIIDRRGKNAERVLHHLPDAVTKPLKISDNSHKRQQSLLVTHKVESEYIVAVVEQTKTPGVFRVVSAFLMDHKTHKKLIDISGRAERRTGSSI